MCFISFHTHITAHMPLAFSSPREQRICPYQSGSFYRLCGHFPGQSSTALHNKMCQTFSNSHRSNSALDFLQIAFIFPGGNGSPETADVHLKCGSRHEAPSSCLLSGIDPALFPSPMAVSTRHQHCVLALAGRLCFH